MDQNGKTLKELVKIAKEQHKMNIYAEKRMQLHYTLLREQREWLKDHEVRLKSLEK